MRPLHLVFVLSLLHSAAAAQRVVLVHNGRATSEIVVAADAPAPVRHGAVELQTFIKQMSGAELPIVNDDRPKRGRALIVINVDPNFGEEELCVKTEPGRLVITGGGKRGALYGCYAFLEETLGCRWFTASISRIPNRKTIVVGPLDIHEKPAFEYREPYYTEALDRDWAVRNRTNGNAQRLDAEVGGKVSYGKFVHTFNELVPPEQYFDTHPEYFSLINGKRMKGYYQLCLTNPDVLKIAIAKVRDWIRENPDATIFSVSQNDTYNNCQCDNCKAVEKEEGAPSGPLLRFVNAVAAEIGKDHPNVLIDTLAYQWSEDPPQLTKPLPNVRIRLAPIGACFSHPLDGCPANAHAFANLQAWSKITSRLYVWHYSTNFSNYLQPLPDLDEIAGDIPLFHSHGVVGLFYEGDYAPGGGGEMSELKAYLMAKLMWNPSVDPKPIIAEYVNGVYGKGAPFIRQWLDLLHKPERENGLHARIYDRSNAPYLAPEILKRGLDLFAGALKATANDPQAREQVERAELALQYARLMQLAEIGDSPERADLTRIVVEKIKRYGIGQVREGEPVEKFFERIGAAK